ncbi:hypothetical protein VZO05_01235 [Aggregatilineales bacterium SYSU G02658]
MTDELEIDYDALRQRVIEKTQRRYRFIAHTVLFALGFPLMGSWGSIPLLLWILAWAFHLLWLSYHHSLEQALNEAIAQEEARLAKAKRDYYGAALDDDSELITDDDEDYRAYRF